MEDLNQFVISRVLGSTMKHIKRPTFGPLGVLHAQNQIIAHRPVRGEQISFAPRIDRLIIRSFEENRKGLPLEKLLADPARTAKMLRRAKGLGVQAEDYAILLRLLQYRKNPTKKFRLSKPTAVEPRRDHSAYLFAAEMALTQMRYRYGASVDDILAYPNIGREFDELSDRICPGHTPNDFRLAALYIRKSRYCGKDERTLFDALDTRLVEKKLHRFATLDKIEPSKLSGFKGVVGLVEENKNTRYLYLTKTSDASQFVKPFIDPRTLNAVSNHFWKPSLETIRLYAFDIGYKYESVLRTMWAKKLIQQKSPIFNQPIHVEKT